ncbi:hypothetical protein Dimus_030337 [Dionaea muscipula]
MCQLKRENGVWWLGTGDHRRRDDDVEECEHMEKEVEADESVSGEKFFYAEDEVQESVEVSEEVPYVPTPALVQQKEKAPAGVDPSGLTGSIPDFIFSSLQIDFETAHANRIQADLERAQAENARLLALLQQAQ